MSWACLVCRLGALDSLALAALGFAVARCGFVALGAGVFAFGLWAAFAVFALVAVLVMRVCLCLLSGQAVRLPLLTRDPLGAWHGFDQRLVWPRSPVRSLVLISRLLGRSR